jgi:hypothetical protein
LLLIGHPSYLTVPKRNSHLTSLTIYLYEGSANGEGRTLRATRTELSPNSHERGAPKITKTHQQHFKATNMTERDLQTRIEFMVEAILDGVNKRHPNTMDELLQKNEFGNNKTLTKTVKENVSEPYKVTRLETIGFELLRASLGFIFLERYGWTEEAIDGMTLPEVFIALEHAMECDTPSKKSVWNL